MHADPHFLAIKAFYGNRCAERSGVPFINHISEGLCVLAEINASLAAKRAYCLHPVLQSDADFATAFDHDSVLRQFPIDPHALALAVEYRSVANEYLSSRAISSINEIRLSPVADVNDMLIADKVQNRKDFLIYHVASHPRSDELSQYFVNWLTRLGRVRRTIHGTRPRYSGQHIAIGHSQQNRATLRVCLTRKKPIHTQGLIVRPSIKRMGRPSGACAIRSVGIPSLW